MSDARTPLAPETAGAATGSSFGHTSTESSVGRVLDAPHSRDTDTHLVPSVAPAVPGSLQYAIERWEAAHPGFVRLFECIDPIMTVIVPTKADKAVRQAASHIGISVEEYARQRGMGRRWCTHHRLWHPGSEPFVTGTSVCQAGAGDYKRERRAVQKRRAS